MTSLWPHLLPLTFTAPNNFPATLAPCPSMNTPGWLSSSGIYLRALPQVDGQTVDQWIHTDLSRSSPSPSYSNITFSGGLFWLYIGLPVSFPIAALSPSDMLSTLLILSLPSACLTIMWVIETQGFLLSICSLLNPQHLKHCLAHGGHEIFVWRVNGYHKITWEADILEENRNPVALRIKLKTR